MKKIFLLFIAISLIACKSEDKYYPEHGYKGKVRKVTITKYKATALNGSIKTQSILFQSYRIYDEKGKKVDGHTDFSNLESDEFKERTFTKKTDIDNHGNCTEIITYFKEDGSVYAITKAEFTYYE
jgi:hypothetical protein